jgi:LPXTG-motif cell wall-anchored protein
MNRRRLRVPMAIRVVGAAMAVAAAPLLSPGGVVAHGVGQAGYDGVTFNYDTPLATAVRGQTVASNVGQDGLITEVRPEHVSFAFDGYPSKGVWTPRIRVIPLAAYKAAQADTAIGGALQDLERYLDGETGGQLPFLPPVNAVRHIGANAAPVAGAGVSGVRFLASYGQDLSPVREDNITYMFIGLTADSAYYVEGTFPVGLSTPLDPAPSSFDAESVQAYNQALAGRLEATGTSGFVPSLDKLDKMMASMHVTGGAVEPTTSGMPRTGSAQDSSWLLLAGVAAGVVAVGAGILVRRRTSPPGR